MKKNYYFLFYKVELQKEKKNTFNLLHLKNGNQPQIMKGLKNLPQQWTIGLLSFGDFFFPTVFSFPFPFFSTLCIDPSLTNSRHLKTI